MYEELRSAIEDAGGETKHLSDQDLHAAMNEIGEATTRVALSVVSWVGLVAGFLKECKVDEDNSGE